MLAPCLSRFEFATSKKQKRLANYGESPLPTDRLLLALFDVFLQVFRAGFCKRLLTTSRVGTEKQSAVAAFVHLIGPDHVFRLRIDHHDACLETAR